MTPQVALVALVWLAQVFNIAPCALASTLFHCINGTDLPGDRNSSPSSSYPISSLATSIARFKKLKEFHFSING